MLVKKNYVTILADLTQGAIIGVTSALYAVVLAFIFFNQYPEHISDGIIRIIISSVTTCIVIGIISKEKIVFADSITMPGLILSSLATSLIANKILIGVDTFWYYIGMINLTCFATGIIMYGLAKYKLSIIVRYIPNTAVTAFLAAILIQSFIMILSLSNFYLEKLATSLQWANFKLTLYTLIPGLVIGSYLFYLEIKEKQPFFHLSVLCFFIFIFYGYCFSVGISLDELRNSYRMLFPYQINDSSKHIMGIFQLFNTDHSFSYNLQNMFGTFNVDILLASLPNILLVILTTCFFSLLGIATLELDFNKEIDMDNEIDGVAKSCLINPLLGGGLIGKHAVEYIHTAVKANSQSKLVGIIGFCIPYAAVTFFQQLFLNIPKFVILAILFRTLLSMLWLIVIIPIMNSRFRDKLIILAGVILMMEYGLAFGMIVTVLLILIQFSLEYMRCKIIKAKFFANNLPSTTSRDLVSNIILDKYGDTTIVWLLQGYIFFGNIYDLKIELLQTIQNKIEKNITITTVILDFKSVQGTDANFIFHLNIILSMLERHNIILCITHSNFSRRLLKSKNLYFFHYLDECLVWNENRIFTTHAISNDYGFQHLHKIFAYQVDRETFKNFYEIVYSNQHSILYSEKSFISKLYFLIYGKVDLISTSGITTNETLVCQSVKAGTFIGDAEIFIDSVAKSTAITKTKCIIITIESIKLVDLEDKHPNLANILYRYLLSNASYKLNRSKLIANETLGFRNP